MRALLKLGMGVWASEGRGSTPSLNFTYAFRSRVSPQGNARTANLSVTAVFKVSLPCHGNCQLFFGVLAYPRTIASLDGGSRGFVISEEGSMGVNQYILTTNLLNLVHLCKKNPHLQYLSVDQFDANHIITHSFYLMFSQFTCQCNLTEFIEIF